MTSSNLSPDPDKQIGPRSLAIGRLTDTLDDRASAARRDAWLSMCHRHLHTMRLLFPR